MEKIRVGLLGPGRIVKRVMTDWDNVRECELTAVASRSPERAREAADAYGAKYAFGSYEEMARSPEVDLVYIATPHNFHCEQALLMMEHGKHVLCEKPMPLNDEECLRMIECAKRNNVFLMEAMWTRYMPASEAICRLVADGAIGEVTHYLAQSNSNLPFDPQSRLYARELAGGILMDMGIYALSPITMLLGCDFEAFSGFCAKAPTGVDKRAAIQIAWKNGATAQLLLSMDAILPPMARISGTKGEITMQGGIWAPTSFTLTDASGKAREYRFPDEHEGHHYEFDHAAACIRQGRSESPVMPLSESLAISRLFTTLRKQWGVIYPEEEHAEA